MARTDSVVWRVKALILLSLLGFAVVLGVAHWLLVNQIVSSGETSARTFADEAGKSLAVGRTVDRRAFDSFVAREPRVGYLVVSDFRTGYRSGLFNTGALGFAGPDLEKFRKENGDSATLARIIRPREGFPGEYLHVVAVALTPNSESSDRTPLGILKIGVVIPGYVPGVASFGRGFGNVVVALWSLCLAIGIGVLAWRPRTRTEPVLSVSLPPQESEALHDLAWLEAESGETEIVEVDELGRSWKILFNGSDLTGWSPKGEWYVAEGEITGQPWGGSIVSMRVNPTPPYSFQATAKKLAGEDGFVILFTFREHFLSWVIGGWGNSRSEVAGYETTRSETSVSKGQWYHLELYVGTESLRGMINGVKVWELDAASVTHASPDAGFLQGIGMGVWSTLVKFRNLRFTNA